MSQWTRNSMKAGLPLLGIQVTWTLLDVQGGVMAHVVTTSWRP